MSNEDLERMIRSNPELVKDLRKQGDGKGFGAGFGGGMEGIHGFDVRSGSGGINEALFATSKEEL